MNKYDELKKGREIFDEIFKPLAQTLNEFHGLSKNEINWYYLISFWLNSIIFYDLQLKHLKSIKKIQDYSKFKNEDFLDFTKLLQNKNFYIFYKNELKNKSLKFEIICKYFLGQKIQNNLLIHFLNIFRGIFWKLYIKIFNASYFSSFSISKEIKNKLIFGTKFKLIPFYPFNSKKDIKYECNLNSVLRFKLYNAFIKKKPLLKNDHFIKIIFLLIPCNYIENFHILRNDISGLISYRPKNIYSDLSEIYDERFKLLLCFWIKQGSRLYNIQHSANHIELNLHSFYEYWTKYSFKYITWGWSNNKNNTISLPSLRVYAIISNFKKMKNKFKKKYNIVFFPRVLFKFPHFSLHLSQELQLSNKISTINLIKFFKKKPVKLFLKTRDKNLYSTLKYNIISNKYKSQIIFLQSKLCVFNHLSTGFLECIFLNVPAVILVSKNNSLMYESESYKEINYILCKYNLICNSPSEIYKIYKKNNKEYFSKIYESLLLDQNFNKIFLNVNDSIKQWLIYLNKNL